MGPYCQAGAKARLVTSPERRPPRRSSKASDGHRRGARERSTPRPNWGAAAASNSPLAPPGAPAPSPPRAPGMHAAVRPLAPAGRSPILSGCRPRALWVCVALFIFLSLFIYLPFLVFHSFCYFQGAAITLHGSSHLAVLYGNMSIPCFSLFSIFKMPPV